MYRVPQAGRWWPTVGAPLERGARSHSLHGERFRAACAQKGEREEGLQDERKGHSCLLRHAYCAHLCHHSLRVSLVVPIIRTNASTARTKVSGIARRGTEIPVENSKISRKTASGNGRTKRSHSCPFQDQATGFLQFGQTSSLAGLCHCQGGRSLLLSVLPRPVRQGTRC